VYTTTDLHIQERRISSRPYYLICKKYLYYRLITLPEDTDIIGHAG